MRTIIIPGVIGVPTDGTTAVKMAPQSKVVQDSL